MALVLREWNACLKSIYSQNYLTESRGVESKFIILLFSIHCKFIMFNTENYNLDRVLESQQNSTILPVLILHFLLVEKKV